MSTAAINPPSTPGSGSYAMSTSASVGGPSSSTLLPPSSPPPATMTTRSRSASQPIRPPRSPGSHHLLLSSPSNLRSGAPLPSSSGASVTSSPSGMGSLHIRSVSRSLSSNAINKVAQANPSFLLHTKEGADANLNLNMNLNKKKPGHNRHRSSSLVTVTEVGGDDEPEGVVDRYGAGVNQNAQWVNGPGSWLIHPVLILMGKLIIDAIPSITQDLSWTITNLTYVALSYAMFHSSTGIPFESGLISGGAYDDLTLWEQIDQGAQYTPAKKWLTTVPICLFLVSTHYTKYDPLLFTINFVATLFVVFPKLPILHRLRFHFFPKEANTADASVAPTPMASRPPSPRLSAIMETEKTE